MSNIPSATNPPTNAGERPLRVDTQGLPTKFSHREVRLRTEQDEVTSGVGMTSGPEDSATWTGSTGIASASLTLDPQASFTSLTEQELSFWQVEENLAPLATHRSRALAMMASVLRYGQKPPLARMLEEAGYDGYTLEPAAGIAREMAGLRSHRIGFASFNIPCPPEVIEKAREMYLRRYRVASDGNASLLGMESSVACQHFVAILEDLLETNIWVKLISDALKVQRVTSDA